VKWHWLSEVWRLLKVQYKTGELYSTWSGKDVTCNNGKTILAHLPQLHAELQYKLQITDQQNRSDEKPQSRTSFWLLL